MGTFKIRKLILFPIVSACLSFSLLGCGGGTVGTGTGGDGSGDKQSYIEGLIVRDGNGTGVARASITVEETGDDATSDSDGHFSIAVSSNVSEVTLRVDAPGVSRDAKVKQPISPGESISVVLSVNAQENVVQAEAIAAHVGIVGACNNYFENTNPIRQANALPENGTVCTVKARVFGDGEPLGHVQIAVQKRACRPGATWDTVATGLTDSGPHIGVAQVDFSMFDSVSSCVYQVVVPFQYKGYKPILTKILTFTAREQEKN